LKLCLKCRVRCLGQVNHRLLWYGNTSRWNPIKG
jgi:hypothetical protein